MTATENLVAVTRAPEGEAFARAGDSLDFVGLSPVADEFAANLSYGQQKLLEFARVLVNDPDVILLDEPFTGIDPVTIHSIQKIIMGLRDDGISILITDHRERETLAITDRSYIVRAGKILCHGTAEEVLNNPDAKKYYFGETPPGNPLDSTEAA